MAHSADHTVQPTMFTGLAGIDLEISRDFFCAKRKNFGRRPVEGWQSIGGSSKNKEGENEEQTETGKKTWATAELT